LQIRFKEQSEDGPPFKPRGLWVSDEEDPDQGWREWSIREDWNLPGLEHAYEIQLAKNHNVLILTAEWQVREFTYKLGSNIGYGNAVWEINWDVARAAYDGLIITPYQYACRTDPSTIWYNGWDCASGCIWNVEKIDICQKLY